MLSNAPRPPPPPLHRDPQTISAQTGVQLGTPWYLCQKVSQAPPPPPPPTYSRPNIIRTQYHIRPQTKLNIPASNIISNVKTALFLTFCLSPNEKKNYVS